jgi:hypothetical protein
MKWIAGLVTIGVLAGCSHVVQVQVQPGADFPNVEYAPDQYARFTTSQEGIIVHVRGVQPPLLVVQVFAEQEGMVYVCEKIIPLERFWTTATQPCDTGLGKYPTMWMSKNLEASEGVELLRDNQPALYGSYDRTYLIRWTSVAPKLAGPPEKLFVTIKAYWPQTYGARFDFADPRKQPLPGRE